MVISRAATHSAPQIKFISDFKIGNDGGYALARTTHGFDSGCWYFEVTFEEASAPDGHIRLGLAQILAEAQAPVGYDEYSYGIRDKDGAAMHCGVNKVYASPFKRGDTVGVLLRLPSDLNKAPISESLRAETEKAYPPKGLGSYRVKQDILADPAASICFTVNGQNQGIAFKNIYKAKYYPAVSLYGGAEASFNFGPDFKFPCPAQAKNAHLIAVSE